MLVLLAIAVPLTNVIRAARRKAVELAAVASERTATINRASYRLGWTNGLIHSRDHPEISVTFIPAEHTNWPDEDISAYWLGYLEGSTNAP